MKRTPIPFRPVPMAALVLALAGTAHAQSSSTPGADTSAPSTSAPSTSRSDYRAAPRTMASRDDGYSLIPYSSNGYIGFNLGKPSWDTPCGGGGSAGAAGVSIPARRLIDSIAWRIFWRM